MFLRYFGVSAIALVVDVAALALLRRLLGLDEALAAAIAYLIGAVVHYLVSRRHVFQAGWLGVRPSLELGAFLACGVCGAAVTVLVVGFLTDALDVSLAVAKLVAVLVSFLVVYLLRSRLVFRAAVRRV